MLDTKSEDGRRRVIIEGVAPEIDGGRFPIKRTVGERVLVEADIFTDGHDAISCLLQYRKEDATEWSEVAFEPLVNDRWRAEFTVSDLGRYRYTIAAWVDHFKSWRQDLAKRVQEEDIAVALSVGILLVKEAMQRASGPDAERLRIWVNMLGSGVLEDRHRLALDEELALLMARHPDRRHAGTYGRELIVTVDSMRARFSAWYEMFPRSCSSQATNEPGRHGSFRDCEARFPYIAEMGFDVLYLPPIHPIGHTKRKGPNNSLNPAPGDPGSPWAIGSEAGGHKAIHPEMGTLEDFRRFVARAQDHGLEIALDIAFQCSPDHPYVKEHPEWFRHRPDGTIQYAENPPKKYQDIYPFDFETEAWQSLWEELKSVFLFWIAEGVHIFRVDNPHTKAFAFWEWVIGELKRDHPESDLLVRGIYPPQGHVPSGQARIYPVLHLFLLAQCQVGYHPVLHRAHADPGAGVFPAQPLAQHTGHPERVPSARRPRRLYDACGTGRHAGGELWHLRSGLRAFEHRARELGSEEYLDSEKYQIRHWDLIAAGQHQGLYRRASTLFAATTRPCSPTGACASIR